jgi:amylosucrase
VPPGAGWITYVRCHDDIGWAITQEDASAVGENGHLHRKFLSDFYAGDFPGSFARGARFQPEPTGEARTSGTAASLAGLEAALEHGDPVAEELAIRRILLLHAVAFAHGGLPLIYMGDELGLRSDDAWQHDPARADDNRWMHRPPMDWDAAARRHDPASAEGRLWAGLRRLIAVRRATWTVHAQATAEPLWSGNDHVLALMRDRAGERLLLLANFSPYPQAVPLDLAHGHGVVVTPEAWAPDGRPLRQENGMLVLDPYAHAWLRG